MRQSVGQLGRAPANGSGAPSAFRGPPGAAARCLAAAVLAMTVVAEALPGYLTLVGPGPLRFQTPGDPFAGIAALPPLLMRDPEPEVLTNAVVVATNTPAPAEAPAVSAAAPVKPVAVGVPTNAPPNLATNATAGTNAVATAPKPAAPVLEPGGSQTVLTPQMLLQFFQKPGGGTNAPGSKTSVVMPLFTPAQPNASPGSRATYTSP